MEAGGFEFDFVIKLDALVSFHIWEKSDMHLVDVNDEYLGEIIELH